MKDRNRFLRIEVNTFPTHDVRAIGLKFAGSLGQADAELFGEWSESDSFLAKSVVPAVLAAPTVDAKHEALCQGIYNYFSSQYGCRLPRKPRRKRRHVRRLKRITAQKNEARKQFRKAKAIVRSSGN